MACCGERQEQRSGGVEEAETYANSIRRYREIVNYRYWWLRSLVEQRPESIAARKNMFEAEELFRAAAKLTTSVDGKPGAKEHYKTAFDAWGPVFDEMPELMEAPESEDLVEAARRYAGILDQLDEPFPADFPIRKLIEGKDPTWKPWEQAKPPCRQTGVKSPLAQRTKVSRDGEAERVGGEP